MRCVSWNVNGIRAVAKKGQLPWQVVPDSDVVCIQESKAQPAQLAPEIVEPPGWHSCWSSAERKGYSGVAIFCREQPDAVIEGLGEPAFDVEGRVIAVRFGELVVVSAYFPNSQDAGKRLDYKLGFCAAMEAYLARLRGKGREIVLLGDYNIAHQPIDLARPKANEGNPGYLPEERAWFGRFLELGYRDVYREMNPDQTDCYTWWSYRLRARERNIGWRIDYSTTTPALRDRVRAVRHHPEVLGSDHCPVSITLR